MKNIIKLSVIGLLLLTTGCIKRDSFEGINIYTSVYPIEYITERLYGDNSTIYSIYPDDIDFSSYTLNEKQIKDYSMNSDLFIFNSKSIEKEYVIPMYDYNNNIKIIDATNTMDIDYAVEELWLDPSNLLKVLRNVHSGFEEYITNQYLKNELDANYEELRLEISSISATLRQVTKNASDKTIVVGNDLYRFLEKYDFNVISLDGTVSDKTIASVKNLISSGQISYIFVKDENDINENVKYFVDNYEVTLSEIHTLSNLSDEERAYGRDYYFLMNENIEKLKSEIFE